MLSWAYTKNPELRGYYWKNFFKGLAMGGYRFEIVLSLMGIYLHFSQHTRHLTEIVNAQRDAHDNVIKDVAELAEYRRTQAIENASGT